MESLVHRCRFVEYQPKSITCMAFTPKSAYQHSTQNKTSTLLLAVAREAGNIEIWNPQQNYLLENIIPLNKDDDIQSLVWVHETKQWDTDLVEDNVLEDVETLNNENKTILKKPRLFSAGLDGLIKEWDLKSLSPKYSTDSGGGAVWCMAENHLTNKIAVGCEDGRVRIFEVKSDSHFEHNNQKLIFIKCCDKTEARILSLAWHPDGVHLVAGTSDGFIKKINIQSGRIISRMKADSIKNEETLVWSLDIIKTDLSKDIYTVVSGDSLGNVCFWDWETCTIKQSLKAHSADVLCLASNQDGTIVYSSGVDRVIIQHKILFQKIPDSAPKTKWISSVQRRYHSHDVRALVLFNSKGLDILVCGGVDTNLIVSSPASKLEKVKPHRLPSWPHNQIVSLVKEKRWAVEKKDDGIKIWSLGEALATNFDDCNDKDRLSLTINSKLLMHLNFKMETNLLSYAISPNGKLLAISDSTTIKLFEIKEIKNNLKNNFVLKRITSFNKLIFGGAQTILFSNDSTKLILGCLDSILRILLITRNNTKEYSFEVLKSFEFHCSKSNHTISNEKFSSANLEDELITGLAISNDDKYLCSGDSGNRVVVVNLIELKVYSILPKLSSKFTTLTFNPSSTKVVLTLTNNEIYFFELKIKNFDEWTRKNIKNLPKWLTNKKENIFGLSFLEENKFLFYSANYSCFVDLTKDLPSKGSAHFLKRKRKNKSSEKKKKSSEELEFSKNKNNNKKETNFEEEKKKLDQVEEEENNNQEKVEVDDLNFKKIDRFQPLIHLDFLNEKELVVIERPFLKIMEKLPPGFYRHKYGSG